MITFHTFHILMFVALVTCLEPFPLFCLFLDHIFHLHVCHWLQPGSLSSSMKKHVSSWTI